MKGKRKGASQVEWYTSELKILRERYSNSTRTEIVRLIPRHTLKGINAKAFRMGYKKGRFEYVKVPKCTDPLLLKIFDFMREHNLTADDVGKEAGLGGGSTIRYWAKGTHSPKLKHLRKLLSYLDLDLKLVPV